VTYDVVCCISGVYERYQKLWLASTMDRFIKEVSENWIGLAIINVYCLSLSVNAPLSVQLISL